jgi:LysM repeat protein
MDGISRIVLAAATATSALALMMTMTPTLSAAPGVTDAISSKLAPVVREKPAAPPAVSAVNVPAAPPRYTVRVNDTLSSIAGRLLGSTSRWPSLWWVNRSKVTDPNSLYVGESLALPPSGLNIPGLLQKALAAISGYSSYSQAAQVSTEQAGAPVSTGGAFEQCVIRAESGGNPRAYNPSTASGLFGFLLSTWDSLGLGYPGGAYTAPISVQEEGFDIEYARDGTSPWAPYDGC